MSSKNEQFQVSHVSSNDKSMVGKSIERQEEGVKKVRLGFPSPFATASAAIKEALQKVQMPDFVKEQKPIFAPVNGGSAGGSSVAFTMAHLRCI